MFYPNDRVIARPDIWNGGDVLSGKIIKYLGNDIYWVEWDQDTEYARAHNKFKETNLQLENDMRFELGDIVATRWNQNIPGTVVSVANVDSVRQKVSLYFEREMNTLEYNNSDLVLVKRNTTAKEDKVTVARVLTIALKPIQSEARIKNGNWTHVVIDLDSELAIAAFTSIEDAEQFIEDYCFSDSSSFIVREVA